MMNARQIFVYLGALMLFMVLRGVGVSMAHVGVVFAAILGMCLVVAIGIAALNRSFR